MDLFGKLKRTAQDLRDWYELPEPEEVPTTFPDQGRRNVPGPSDRPRGSTARTSPEGTGRLTNPYGFPEE